MPSTALTRRPLPCSSVRHAALARAAEAADLAGRAVAAVEDVAAAVACLAALDALGRARGRHAVVRRTALAGAAAAAVLAGRARPAGEEVAAAVARGPTVDALSGAGRRRAERHVRLNAGRQIEEHELEDLLLRSHRVVVALGGEGHAMAVVRRRGGELERAVGVVARET